jgi:tubulin polyglutamylase TTLL7
MDHMYRVCQPECIDNSMCFQILGFDIMIDKNFRPWLIEVNQSPSFSTDSPLDYEVKKNVLRDALQMLDMSQERRENYIRIRNEQNQERMMTGKTFKMTPQEREKLRHDRIQVRMDFERIKLNGSGYE